MKFKSKLNQLSKVITLLLAFLMLSVPVKTFALSNYYTDVKEIVLLKENYDEFYDINGDGTVNVFDAIRINQNEFLEDNKKDILELKNEMVNIKSNLDTIRANNQWKSKVWYAYGTSLTAGEPGRHYSYAPILAEKLEMNLVNKGHGGSGITTASDGANKIAMMDLTDGKLTADLITLEVSANDGNAEIGASNDQSDNTICGALNQILRKILVEGQYNGFIAVIPSTLSRYPASGSSSAFFDPDEEYATKRIERYKAIEEVCERWNVPCWNAAKENGINVYKQGVYVDNVHLTQYGATLQANALYKYAIESNPY